MQSDSLFDEIEQFLADGGEPAEPTPEERMAAAFEAFGDAVQAMANAIAEAFKPLFDAIAEWAKGVTEQLTRLHISLRRDQVRAKLEAWRVPRPVATWIAHRWPRRWLPELAIGPP